MQRSRRYPEDLPHLPVELWTNIFSFVRHKDLPNVASCSKKFHMLSLPFLYEDIEFTNQKDNSTSNGIPSNTLPLTQTFHDCTKGLDLSLFTRSIYENSELRGLIKSVHFNTTGGKDNILLCQLASVLQPGQIHLGVRCRLDLFSTGISYFNLTSLDIHCGRTEHISPIEDGRLAFLLQTQPTLKRLYLTCNCYCPHFHRALCKIEKPLNLEHLSVTDICHHWELFEEILRNCVSLRSLYYCSEAMPSMIHYRHLEALPNLLLKHAETLETLYLWVVSRFGGYGLPKFLHNVDSVEPLTRFTSLKRLSVPAHYLIFAPHLRGGLKESAPWRRRILALLPPGLEELHVQMLLDRCHYHQKLTENLVDCLRAVVENKIAQRTPQLDKVVLWTTNQGCATQRVIQPFKDIPGAMQLRRSCLEQDIKLSFWQGDTGPLFADPDLQRLQAESFGHSGLSYTRREHRWAVESIRTPYYRWDRSMPLPQRRISWDDIDSDPEYYRMRISAAFKPTVAYTDTTFDDIEGSWQTSI